MIAQVLKFIRLPLFLLVVFGIARFSLGLAGVPYAPRGNAMFSLVVLTLVSSVYFGALSGRVGGLNWRVCWRIQSDTKLRATGEIVSSIWEHSNRKPVLQV
jgi:hypothetical protein